MANWRKMIVVVVNIISVAVLLWINPRYVISFEVAFVGAMCVVWSSYRAVMRKISLMVESNAGNSPLELHSTDSHSQTSSLASRPKTKFARKFAESNESQTENPFVVDSLQCVESNKKNVESPPDFGNLPKKERFFVGMRLSFGLLRLLSYAFIGISIIALINNGAFYAIPFLAGIALSTLSTTLYTLKKQKGS